MLPGHPPREVFWEGLNGTKHQGRPICTGGTMSHSVGLGTSQDPLWIGKTILCYKLRLQYNLVKSKVNSFKFKVYFIVSVRKCIV